MAKIEVDDSLVKRRKKIVSLKEHLNKIAESNNYRVHIHFEDASVPYECLNGWIYEEGKLRGGVLSILVLTLLAPIVQRLKERKVLWFAFGEQNGQFHCRIQSREIDMGFASKFVDVLTQTKQVDQAKITVLPSVL